MTSRRLSDQSIAIRRHMIRAIEQRMDAMGIPSVVELAKVVRMPYSTLASRMNGGTTFSLEETVQIAAKLDLAWANLLPPPDEIPLRPLFFPALAMA